MDESILKNIIENYETPTYVFDIPKLKKRLEYLRDALPSKLKFCYAIKANPFIIKEIEEYVDRFEVCSPGEYYICREKEIDINKILISGVYKTQEIIFEMINDGITNFTIESLEQFELLKSTNKNLKVIIRITSGNQFGINLEEAEDIIKNNEKLDILGIQYFSGTQKKSIKNLGKELSYVQEFINLIKEKYNFETRELEFGPGFPVSYFQNEEFDEKQFFAEFSELINNLEYKGQFILEFGRSMVANC